MPACVMLFMLCFSFSCFLCLLCIDILLLFPCLLCIVTLLLFQCLLCIIILLLFQCLLCIILLLFHCLLLLIFWCLLWLFKLVSNTFAHEPTIKYLNQPTLCLKCRESKASTNGDGIFYCSIFFQISFIVFNWTSKAQTLYLLFLVYIT